eukprot:Phypoly_transcript_25315.p1 GENE.Phypoly_transcript_25315~~Phypoly_transcript_25315.p1  ORF type:complete len:141 (+),score=17.09 Phypoly_transcript_25315:55-477(+)
MALHKPLSWLMLIASLLTGSGYFLNPKSMLEHFIKPENLEQYISPEHLETFKQLGVSYLASAMSFLPAAFSPNINKVQSVAMGLFGLISHGYSIYTFVTKGIYLLLALIVAGVLGLASLYFLFVSPASPLSSTPQRKKVR